MIEYPSQIATKVQIGQGQVLQLAQIAPCLARRRVNELARRVRNGQKLARLVAQSALDVQALSGRIEEIE